MRYRFGLTTILTQKPSSILWYLVNVQVFYFGLRVNNSWDFIPVCVHATLNHLKEWWGEHEGITKFNDIDSGPNNRVENDSISQINHLLLLLVLLRGGGGWRCGVWFFYLSFYIFVALYNDNDIMITTF